MTERINITNEVHNRTPVNYLLISVMTELCKDKGEDILKLFNLKQGPNEDAVADVEFKINGVEVSLSSWLKKFEEQYDNDIARKAKELIKERAQEISNFLEELKEHIGYKYPELIRDYDD